MIKMKKKKKKRKPLQGLSKEERLEKAKVWIEQFEGDNIIKAYSKITGFNLKNAMNELRRLGAPLDSEEIARVKQTIQNRKLHNQRKREKKKREREEQELLAYLDSDETFAYIAGYTSGGAPYGVTHEQMQELEEWNENNPADE